MFRALPAFLLFIFIAFTLSTLRASANPVSCIPYPETNLLTNPDLSFADPESGGLGCEPSGKKSEMAGKMESDSSSSESSSAGNYPEYRMAQNLKRDYANFIFLIQSKFRYSFNDTDFQGGRTFQVPISYIGLIGELGNDFYYRLLFNVSASPALQDVFLGWRPTEAFGIQIGSMKGPVSDQWRRNPVAKDFIDRQRILRELGIRFEFGAMALGQIAGLNYYAGVFNGTGRLVNDNNKFEYAGRLERIQRLGQGALTVALNGSLGEYDVAPGRPIPDAVRTVLGGDFRYEDETIFLAGEYLHGNYRPAYDMGPFITSTVILAPTRSVSGYYLAGGYYLRENLLGKLRWQQWFESLDQENEGSQITLGTKHYKTSVISLEANFDIFLPATELDTQYGLSLSANIWF